MINKVNFDTINPNSPVSEQVFIWVAEYTDYSGLTEYDLQTGEDNNFNLVEIDKINRFGLIGEGHKLYFSKHTGTFHMLNSEYTLMLCSDNQIINLNTVNIDIAKVITYKRAEADLVKTNNIHNKIHKMHSTITGYYFGYEALINYQNRHFNFKPIVCIEQGKPMHIKISLSCNENFSGVLKIIKDNEVVGNAFVSIVANHFCENELLLL